MYCRIAISVDLTGGGDVILCTFGFHVSNVVGNVCKGRDVRAGVSASDEVDSSVVVLDVQGKGRERSNSQEEERDIECRSSFKPHTCNSFLSY